SITACRHWQATALNMAREVQACQYRCWRSTTRQMRRRQRIKTCPLRRFPEHKKTSSMAIGLIIIGDEILSGKRTDKHFPKAVELLAARGLSLDWAEYLGDDRMRITATLKRTFASDD